MQAASTSCQPQTVTVTIPLYIQAITILDFSCFDLTVCVLPHLPSVSIWSTRLRIETPTPILHLKLNLSLNAVYEYETNQLHPIHVTSKGNVDTREERV